MLKSGDMLKAQLHNGILNPHVSVCCIFKTGFIALPYYHNYFEIVYISFYDAEFCALHFTEEVPTLYMILMSKCIYTHGFI